MSSAARSALPPPVRSPTRLRLAMPTWADAAVAAVVVVAGQVVVWAGLIGAQPRHGAVGENAAVSALTLAALAWRRTAPVAAVVWYTTLFCFLQPFRPHDLPVWTGFLPLVVLAVNAGYRAELWPAVGSLLVALTGLTVLTTVEPVLQSWDTYIFNASIVVPAWVAARTLAYRNDRTRRLSADLTSLAVAQAQREQQAVTQERARIARELHDVVAHSVTVLVIQVGSARVLLDRSPARAREQMMAAESSGREALEELRRLLGVLRPDLADPDAELPATAPQPGLEDLPALVSSFTEAGMELSLTCDGAVDDLAPGLSLTVYRIVQEGLTNALKHAPGARVRVRVGVLPDEVAVTIEDDGSAAPPGPGTGLGLIGLRERVALFAGSYQAGPRAQGWAVDVVLPRSGALTVPARQV